MSILAPTRRSGLPAPVAAVYAFRAAFAATDGSGMRQRWSGAVGALGLVAILAASAGCSEGSSGPSVGTVGKPTDTAGGDGGADAAAKADGAVQADTAAPAVATCPGSALNEGFAAKDGDCKFLEKCPSLGKCYCGDKCPSDKTPRCDDSLCPNKNPKCYCGEQCAPDQKKCPAFVCNFDEKNCKEMDDCLYVNTPAPAWCGCQKMPNHAPDCWCGAKNCTELRPECAATKCAGKDPGKCIYVKGEDYTSCWCDTCGLFGDKAKCFFVLCPNG